MLFFGQKGYRVIAHDRRGHGRSDQTSDGNDMDTYADDLAALFEKLDLKDAIMVGHSTGGGEVARYLGRHGTKRVAKAALVSAITPLMLKTEKNPLGAPIEVFDGLRAALAANRPQFYKDITMPFYGYNRPGAKISEGIRDHWWLQGMVGSVKAHYDCIKVFSETDLTEDLKKIDIPVLVLHSDDDQIVPIAAAGPAAAKLLKHPTLKVYSGSSARHARDPRGPDQCRSARIFQGYATHSHSVICRVVFGDAGPGDSVRWGYVHNETAGIAANCHEYEID